MREPDEILDEECHDYTFEAIDAFHI
jgi:hypothetical protein